MAWRIVTAVVQHPLGVHLKGVCTSSAARAHAPARAALWCRVKPHVTCSEWGCSCIFGGQLGPLTFSQLWKCSVRVCKGYYIYVHGMFLFVYVFKIYLCSTKRSEYSQAHFQIFLLFSLSFTHAWVKVECPRDRPTIIKCNFSKSISRATHFQFTSIWLLKD